MGMLGAMAGLGQGLQDFSKLMNEKSKMDWMAQQEAVKHERALSLEALRNQNQMNLWKEQKGFQIEQAKGEQEFRLKQAEEANKQANLRLDREIQEKDKQITRADLLAQRRIEQEYENQMDRLKFGYSDEAIEGQKKLAGAKVDTEIDQLRRFKELNRQELHSSEYYKMASPEEKKALDFANDMPKAFEAWSAVQKKGVSMTAEAAQKAFDSGIEEFKALDKGKQRVETERIGRLLENPELTTEQAAGFYGQERVIQLGQSLKGNLSGRSSGSTSELSFEDKQKRVQDALDSGRLSWNKVPEGDRQYLKEPTSSSTVNSQKVSALQGWEKGAARQPLPIFPSNPISRAMSRQEEALNRMYNKK